MNHNKITETSKISFNNFISVNELLNEHNAAELSIVDINIGYDDKIYILLSLNIPQRINGMFVNTNADTDYFVFELSVDWESGTLINSAYYGLGRHKPNGHFRCKCLLFDKGHTAYYF